jgi:hypothetical protein
MKYMISILFLFPTILCLAIGTAMVAYGLSCQPPFAGVMTVLSASLPLGAALWLFFSKVI